eukprot:190562_1
MDDPNQRLVNCNNVTVSGNYRSGLDGTYEWLKFSFATNGSIYRCKDCTMSTDNVYLYRSPDTDLQWMISDNYSSIAGWSYASCSSGLSNRGLTMDDCEWKSVISDEWTGDTDLAVESDKCAYTVSTSSFPIYTIILGIICA